MRPVKACAAMKVFLH